MSDELRRLAEAATPGPWRHSGATVWAPSNPDDLTDYSGSAVAYVPTLSDEFDADDAAYLAAVSPDVVFALLDAAERATQAEAGLDAHWNPRDSAAMRELWARSDARDRTLLTALLKEIRAALAATPKEPVT